MTRTAPKLESLSARNRERPRCAHRSSARSGAEPSTGGAAAQGATAGAAASEAKQGRGGSPLRQQQQPPPRPPNLGEDQYCLLETEELLIGAHAGPLSLANRTHG